MFTFKKALATLMTVLTLAVMLPVTSAVAFDVVTSLDGTTVDFGTVLKGGSETQGLTFRNNTDLDLDISVSGFYAGSPFSVASTSDTLLERQGTAEVVFKVNMPTTGTYTDIVTVKFLNDDGVIALQDDFDVTLTAEGIQVVIPEVGQVRQSATTVDFGSVQVNNTVSRTVTFYNDYYTDVNFTIIDGTPSPFSYSYGNTVIPARGSKVVTFYASPTATGTRSDYWQIQTDSTDAKRVYPVYLTVNGIQSNSGGIRKSTSSVDFGTVSVGSNTGYSKSVTFSNDYSRDVYFTIADTLTSPFSWNYSGDAKIPAYGSKTFNFSFFPETSNHVGLNTDTFAIRTDSTDGSRTYSVSLRGEGKNNIGCYDYCDQFDENLIRDYGVDVNYYNGRASADVTFRLKYNSDVDLKVYDEDNGLVTRVFTDRYTNASTSPRTYTYTVTGLNSYGRYRFDLRADSQRVGDFQYYDTDTVYVVVGSQPNPPSYGCAGFVDVDPNSEFCDAVEWAVEEGVFTGDDGSAYFRGGDALLRVEAMASMLRFNDLAATTSYYPLPFYDISDSEWYIPLLRTAVIKKAFSGYPDGTFRPDARMTRAEAYKALVILTKNSGNAKYFISDDVRYRPFADVTLNYANRWYLPYADWARRYFNKSDFAQRNYGAYDLGTTTAYGNFEPGSYMTRAHMVELMYEMHKRALVSN